MSSIVARPDPILVGLTAGADPYVCVKILQEQGFLVHGAVIGTSLEDPNVQAAKQAAEALCISLELLEADPATLTSAAQIELLAEEADRHGIHYLATGHYALVEETENGWGIRPTGTANDQSETLGGISQPTLKRLCLPLGGFDKADVLAMYAEYQAAEANHSAPAQ